MDLRVSFTYNGIKWTKSKIFFVHMPYGRCLAKHSFCLPEQTPVFYFPWILPFTLTKQNCCLTHVGNGGPMTFSIRPWIHFQHLRKLQTPEKRQSEVKSLHVLLHWKSLLNLVTAVFSLVWDFSLSLPATQKHTCFSKGFKIQRWTDFGVGQG